MKAVRHDSNQAMGTELIATFSILVLDLFVLMVVVVVVLFFFFFFLTYRNIHN